MFWQIFIGINIVSIIITLHLIKDTITGDYANGGLNIIFMYIFVFIWAIINIIMLVTKFLL